MFEFHRDIDRIRNISNIEYAIRGQELLVIDTDRRFDNYNRHISMDA